MKNKKGLGIGLITIMVIVCIVLVIMMLVGGKKDSYYGIMKDSTTIDKMINTKNEKIEKNVELPKDANVSVNKEDFVMLFKDEKTGKITGRARMQTLYTSSGKTTSSSTRSSFR